MSRSLSIPASLACALLCCSITALSQTDISLSGGMNFPSLTFDYSLPAWPLAAYWDPGYSVGASVETRFSRVITFVPSVEYASYPWKHETTPAWAVPAWSNIAYGSSPGPGTASRMYRFFADFRVYVFSRDRFGIFISTGAGYVIEQLGTYSVPPGLGHIPELEPEHAEYPVSYYWAHDVGIGTHFFLSGDVGLDFVAKYFSNYTDRFHTSLSLSVFYRIAD